MYCRICLQPQDASHERCINCKMPLHTKEKPQGTPIGFPCSKRKFYTANIVTFGFYSIFWAYKNWRYFHVEEGIKVIPLVRAIFNCFFVYALCRHVQRLGEKFNEPAPTYNPKLLSAIYLVMASLWFLPVSSFSLRLSLTLGVIGSFAFVALAPINDYLAQLNRSQDKTALIAYRPNSFHVLLVFFVVCYYMFLVPFVFLTAAN